MAADRAGEARREDDLLDILVLVLVHRCYQGDTVGQGQGGLERLGQALLEVRANLEAVHHHIDAVLLLLIQLRHFVEFVELAVDPGADEALRAHLVEHRQVLALRSRITGASSISLLPSGRARTWSTIWLTVCASSGMSWSGQRGYRRGHKAGAGSRRSR